MRTRPKTVDAWVRMCLGKKCYRIFEHAEGVAKKFGQRVYFCPSCSGFHCTSRKIEDDKGSKP